MKTYIIVATIENQGNVRIEQNGPDMEATLAQYKEQCKLSGSVIESISIFAKNP